MIEKKSAFEDKIFNNIYSCTSINSIEDNHENSKSCGLHRDHLPALVLIRFSSSKENLIYVWLKMSGGYKFCTVIVIYNLESSIHQTKLSFPSPSKFLSKR